MNIYNIIYVVSHSLYQSCIFHIGVDVSAWGQLDLCEPIVNALKYYKFCEPTQVQTRSLPKALEGRDIIGVAETVKCEQNENL